MTIQRGLLGGSWVVISGVISPLIWVIIIVALLISLLTTTHEARLKEGTGRRSRLWPGKARLQRQPSS